MTAKETAAAIIAIALALVSGSALAQGRVYDRTCEVVSRRSSRGGVACAGAQPANYALSKSYDWSTQTTLATLKAICTSDATCVYACGVGFASGHASNFECIDNTGAALCAGATTNPGTAAVIDSPFPGVKALDITAGSQAPSIACAAISAIYSGDTPSTTIMYGYGRVAGRESNLNWWFNVYAGGATCYNQIYLDNTGAEGGSGPGFYTSKTAPQLGPNPSGTDGWTFIAERVSGNVGGSAGETNLDIALNASVASTAAAGYACVGTPTITFGGNGGSHHLNGPLAVSYGFNTKKTYSQGRAIHDKLSGFGGAVAGVTSVSQGLTVQGETVDNSRVTGNVDNMWTLTQLRDGVYGGLRSVRAHANNWAADALAAATWTDHGGSTVNTDVSSGPFAVLKKGPECDEIVDSSAVAFQGRTSGQCYGYYDGGAILCNASAFLKAGTAGVTTTQARLSFVTDGTMSQPDGGTTGICDFSGLTSTATRVECSVKVTGGTSTVANLDVGNTAAAQGRAQVCHAQITDSPNAEPPEMTNASRGTYQYTLNPVADGWPNAALGGAIELVSTPLWNSSQYAGGFNPGQGSYYEFDAYLSTGTPSADHTVVIVYNYDGVDDLLVSFRDGNVGGNVADIIIPNVARVAGLPDVTRAEWRALGAGKCNLYVFHNSCGITAPDICRATTLVGSDTTGTRFCPGNPDTVQLANRLNGVAATSAVLHAVRIYTP